jgi:hypothetical protein
MRLTARVALLLILGSSSISGRAAQLIVEHFGQVVADNSPIGLATGWTAWAVTNGVVADFSTTTPSGNYPSMSRANNGGFGGVTGNAVLAVSNSANPALIWTNTTTSLHDCVVTNVTFYTKNNSTGSTANVAIQMGGEWYASTQNFRDGGGNALWATNSFTFTTNAGAWRALNTNNLSLGATNASPLPSGDIQSIGIYGFAWGTGTANKIRLDEFIVNGSLPSAPQPGTPTASPSASVTAPTTVTLSVSVAGTPPFTYQWRKGGVNLSDGPTGSGSSLTGSLTNDLVVSTTSTADSGNYDVIVANNYGATTSSVVAVTVTAAGIPPSIAGINVTPSNGTNEVGSAPMSIQVIANGTGPFNYQWRKTDVDILNETNDTLMLASAFTNSGSYSVRVTSAYGAVTSAPPTTLTVVDTTPPVIAFPQGNPTNILINTAFTPVYSVTDNSGVAPNLMITGGVNTNAAGVYTLHFVANDSNNNTNVADLTVNVLLINEHFNQALADNAAVSNAPGWHASAVAVTTMTVTDYTTTGGNGNFPTLSQNVTAPDAIGSTGFLVMGEAANATPSLIWKDTTALLQNHQVTNISFFTRNNSSNTTVQIAIRINTNWYASTATFTDTSGGAVPWVAQNFAFNYDAASWQDLDATALTLGSALTGPLPNLSVSAVGFFGTMTAGKIRLDEMKAAGIPFSYTLTPPSVGTPTFGPTNRVDGSAWTGTPLTFQVAATGSLPLTYIWRKEGVALSTSTNNTFNLASPTSADSGNYDVIVTNASGIAVTSAPVSLNVSASQLLVHQHFNQSTNDPGVIGQLPGWHALAYSISNAVVTDYTLSPNPPLSLNYPNLSLGIGADSTVGYLVLGQGDTVDPVLVWMDTPLAVQQSQVSNILFSSRNNLPSSTMQVAVQISNQWYVSTTLLSDTTLNQPPWAGQNFLFTRDAGAWHTLEISTLALGGTTTEVLPDLPITGIGVYGQMLGVTSARIRIDELMVDGLSTSTPPPSSPTIQPVYRDGLGNLVVRTTTVPGWNYVLESAPALSSPITWTPVLTNAGTGDVITNLVPVNPATQKQFFRYRLQ